MEGLVVLGLFVVCLLIGIPIAYALGMSTLITMLLFDTLNVTYFIQTMFYANDSFTLLAVPFFILAGEIMLVGGISNELINFSKAFLGHITGSLGLITVFTCMIFAAISGSGAATVAAVGGIMIPAMKAENYETEYSCSLAASAGAMGPIIPPSVSFVMYGATVGVPISSLFLAGVFPGILMGVVLMAYAYIMAKRHHWGIRAKKTTAKEKLHALWEAKWALLMPIIILGGIYSGICTPTEAAVVACAYGLVVGKFIYRKINFKTCYKVLANSVMTLGQAVIIIGFASIFGRVLTMLQIPQTLANSILSITDSKVVILLLINLFLFVVGMLMESIAAIVILSPILVAIVQPLGVDLVHFGIILSTNLAVGLTTPPVGVNSFLAAAIGGIKIESMIKRLIPCVILLFLTVLLVTYVPPIATWLPSLLE